MSKDYHSQENDRREARKLTRKSIFVDPAEWEQAKRKADASDIPLAVVVRHLVRAWLEGKISIVINGD